MMLAIRQQNRTPMDPPRTKPSILLITPKMPFENILLRILIISARRIDMII